MKRTLSIILTLLLFVSAAGCSAPIEASPTASAAPSLEPSATPTIAPSNSVPLSPEEEKAAALDELAATEPTDFSDTSAACLVVQVNPKLELYIDAQGTIEQASPLNADAEALVADENFIGRPIADGLLRVFERLREHGYIAGDGDSIYLAFFFKPTPERFMIEPIIDSTLLAFSDAHGFRPNASCRILEFGDQPPVGGETPTADSTTDPSEQPSTPATNEPTNEPTTSPSTRPTAETGTPSTPATTSPTTTPTATPSSTPTAAPSSTPATPTSTPTAAPSTTAATHPYQHEDMTNGTAVSLVRDAAGNIIKRTELTPNGDTLVFEYNADSSYSRVYAKFASGAEIESIYGADGKLKSERLAYNDGTDHTLEKTYDADGRLDEIKFSPDEALTVTPVTSADGATGDHYECGRFAFESFTYANGMYTEFSACAGDFQHYYTRLADGGGSSEYRAGSGAMLNRKQRYIDPQFGGVMLDTWYSDGYRDLYSYNPNNPGLGIVYGLFDASGAEILKKQVN